LVFVDQKGFIKSGMARAMAMAAAGIEYSQQRNEAQADLMRWMFGDDLEKARNWIKGE
jgi:hypothetical protein